MSNTSANPLASPIYEFYTRFVAYLAVCATLFMGSSHLLWAHFQFEFLGVLLAYPIAAYYLGKLIPPRYQHLNKPSFLMIDGFLFGLLIALMHFSPIISLLFVLLINTSVVAMGSLTIWLACSMALILGAYGGTLLFGVQFSAPAHQDVQLTALIGVLLTLAVSALFASRQQKAINQLHDEITQQQAEQKSLSLKVAKYISPQIWESIFSGNREVKLETQRKKLVVFFSDIKGFTALSEQLESEALTALLNNYLTEMTNIALKYGGTIDKYIGDSIMVFFGDPKTQGAKKDTLACVAMAIEMRKHMKVLRQQWRAQGVQTPLEIRMGINTGYCTVGNFGTESRMDYTIIGKEVNMASRLESAAEAGEILISHECYALIQDKILCREKGSITVKGFTRPVPVYQALDFRHNLAAKSSFVEHELPGFSMYMDTTRINNYDRSKIAKALELAADKIKKEAKMNG